MAKPEQGGIPPATPGEEGEGIDWDATLEARERAELAEKAALEEGEEEIRRREIVVARGVSPKIFYSDSHLDVTREEMNYADGVAKSLRQEESDLLKEADEAEKMGKDRKAEELQERADEAIRAAHLIENNLDAVRVVQESERKRGESIEEARREALKHAE